MRESVAVAAAPTSVEERARVEAGERVEDARIDGDVMAEIDSVEA
ncbi:MAG TPA: hypothetical protein VFF72_04050 [Caldimonas sp.]|nr:hypothetical protein [Caldimonas sp.]